MSRLALTQALAASRIHNLRSAVVATIAQALPDVSVRALPGRLDIGDLVSRDSIATPGILVAALRVASERCLPGQRETRVDLALYVVAEDAAFAAAPSGAMRRYERDEIGLALVDALIALCESEQFWGLTDLGLPERVESRPLVAIDEAEKGLACWVVTFSQVVNGQGSPFWAMDGVVTADMPPPPLVFEAGDPDAGGAS